MVLFGAVALVLCFLTYVYRRNIKTLVRQIILKVPSHPSFPIIGHFHKFFGLSSAGKNNSLIVNFFQQRFPTCRSFCCHKQVFVKFSRNVKALAVSSSQHLRQQSRINRESFDVKKLFAASTFTAEVFRHQRRFAFIEM